MHFIELCRVSALLGRTRSRLKKLAILADCLQKLPENEIKIGVSYLTGELPQGRMGIGISLSVNFFDCLHVDGEDLLDRMGSERATLLEQILPKELRVTRQVATTAEEAAEGAG